MIWAASRSGSYPIFVGRGLLGAGGGEWWPCAGRPFCVTDATVGPLYLERLPAMAATVEVPPGEEAKSMAEAERVLRELAQAGMNRDDHLVALGGGVVGDLGGFCAHLYQRGVPVVQVPTTLVAQVDSAYGGKTGVDLPEGKNYAGAYQLPAAVLADTETLASLPPAELAAGFVEALKTGLLAGGSLWERVRQHRVARPGGARRRRLRLRPLQVRGRRRRRARHRPPRRAQPRPHRRPRDRGGGRLRRYRHGEAIGLGLLAALRLSEAPALREEVEAVLVRHGLPTRLDAGADVEAILALLQRDKKRTAAGVGFVLLAEPGEPRIGQLVEPARVRAAVEELLPMTTTHNRVAILHGVNFDILERRDAAFYGGKSLTALESEIDGWARALDLEPIFFQTNHEGEFVEYLHRLPDTADAALVNAGAWTHYSRAIADALDVARLPAVEVHLSDVEAREDWRKLSVFDGLVVAKISGKGVDGYREALELLARELGVGA